MKLSIIGLTIMSLLSQNLMAEVIKNSNLQNQNVAIDRILEMDLTDLRKMESLLSPEIRSEIIAQDISQIAELEHQIQEKTIQFGEKVISLKSNTLYLLLMMAGSTALASPYIYLINGQRLTDISTKLEKQQANIQSLLERGDKYGLLNNSQRQYLNAKLNVINAQLVVTNDKLQKINNNISLFNKRFDRMSLSKIVILGGALVVLPPIGLAMGAGTALGSTAGAIYLYLEAGNIQELQSALAKAKADLQRTQVEIATQQLEEQAAAIN